MSEMLLFGGNPPILSQRALKIIDDFVKGNSVHVLVYTVWRPNWKPYMTKYIEPIKSLKINVTFEYILGDVENASLLDKISEGNIVIFGSGDTMKYFDQFCNEANRSKIKELKEKNILFIGFSAGSLLLGNVGYVSPLDNVSGKSVLRNGLGLYDNFVVSVHHDLWNDTMDFYKATEHLQIIKLSINNAGFVFKNLDGLLLNDTVLKCN
ncbi:hypothetical protein ABMS27_08940 [Lactiplantibacillus plantarum]|uniref:hypothetical protein n=1 Tax=Lactiplantibacillus plantarum TaxID=1590 RepID=UPI001F4C1C4B|nr:hypothetical protein [Lactiplantibacillus plantarum]UNB86451.1 hypothetical protein LXM95_08940 [Lactiplantibacillus plantarum]